MEWKGAWKGETPKAWHWKKAPRAGQWGGGGCEELPPVEAAQKGFYAYLQSCVALNESGFLPLQLGALFGGEGGVV